MYVAGIGVVWGGLQLILSLTQGQGIEMDPKSLAYGLTAGIAVAGSNLLLIESLTRMDVSLGSTIYRLNTIGVVVLSSVLLGESLGPGKAFAVVLGVAAAVTLYGGTRDVTTHLRGFFWLAVLASALRACFGVISKAAILAGVSMASLLFASAVCWLVGGLLYAGLRERRLRVTSDKLAFSLVSGTLVFLVVNTLIWGLERGDASTVIPIANLSFVVALAISVLTGMEAMTKRKVGAIALAAGCIWSMALAA